MKPSYTAIGNYLKGLRESKGIAQLEVATKMKVHVQSVSNWERGTCEPPRQIRKKLAKFLGVKKSAITQVIFTDMESTVDERSKDYLP